MTRLSTSDTRKEFSEALNRVAYQGERILLQRHGKDVAALVSVDDLKLLQALEDRVDLEDARAALAETQRKGSVSWRELKRELGL